MSQNEELFAKEKVGETSVKIFNTSCNSSISK